MGNLYRWTKKESHAEVTIVSVGLVENWEVARSNDLEGENPVKVHLALPSHATTRDVVGRGNERKIYSEIPLKFFQWHCDHPECSHINSSMTEFITIKEKGGGGQNTMSCPFQCLRRWTSHCRESNHVGQAMPTFHYNMDFRESCFQHPVTHALPFLHGSVSLLASI